MKNQQIGVSSAAELASMASKEGLTNPAVIVIGEVVRHAKPEIWQQITKMSKENEQ
jgi:siroheme synthase